MAQREKEKVKLYTIPENFIEGGRIFNGMFRLRNFIEGLVLGSLFALIALAIPIGSVAARISVVLMAALPPLLLGIVGVNGDPLFSFLRTALKWRRTHRIMVYNERVQAYSTTPLDVMMGEDLPKDKLADRIAEWKEKQRIKKSADRANLTFEFEQDTELERLTGDQNKSKKEKKHKGKPHPEIPANQSDEEPAQHEGDNEFSIDYIDTEIQMDENDLFPAEGIVKHE